MKLDLQKQRRLLEAKRAELQSQIAGLTEAHPTPVSPTEAHEGPQDHEDVATDFLATHEEQSILHNEQALLTQVERALQRLENGTYGRCQQCGRPIPLKRLQALPWAERDVRCEAQLEQVYQDREEVYDAKQTF